MASRKGSFVMHNYKHGFGWWILVGWWWRPIRNLFGYIFASIFGFKNIRIVKG